MTWQIVTIQRYKELPVCLKDLTNCHTILTGKQINKVSSLSWFSSPDFIIIFIKTFSGYSHLPESQSQPNLYSFNSSDSINSDGRWQPHSVQPSRRFLDTPIHIDDDEEASLSESDAFFQPEADQSRIIEMNNNNNSSRHTSSSRSLIEQL